MTSFTQQVRELYNVETLANAVRGDTRILSTDLLLLVARLLDEKKLEFAVAGGIAKGLYGTASATEDVDIVVASSTSRQIDGALTEAGFAQTDVIDFFKGRVLITKYQYRGRELDVMTFPRDPEFVRYMLDNRVVQAVLGTSLPVVCLEALMVMKLISFRTKDKSHLIDLLRHAHPDLDTVKSWCATFGIVDRFGFLEQDHTGDE